MNFIRTFLRQLAKLINLLAVSARDSVVKTSTIMKIHCPQTAGDSQGFKLSESNQGTIFPWQKMTSSSAVSLVQVRCVFRSLG